jgi:hypothetical protein
VDHDPNFYRNDKSIIDKGYIRSRLDQCQSLHVKISFNNCVFMRIFDYLTLLLVPGYGNHEPLKYFVKIKIQ